MTTQQEFLRKLVEALERAGIDYMLSGSLSRSTAERIRRLLSYVARSTSRSAVSMASHNSTMGEWWAGAHVV
ncbi:MAG: hypothetical protein AB1486_18415 [Planctomycetota bacterium]